LIVGLTKSPKTSGIVASVVKVIQYLSVVTHADDPGTFKLPLTPSKPAVVFPATNAAPVEKPKQ
jgi:hypothetical protein